MLPQGSDNPLSVGRYSAPNPHESLQGDDKHAVRRVVIGVLVIIAVIGLVVAAIVLFGDDDADTGTDGGNAAAVPAYNGLNSVDPAITGELAEERAR